MPNDYYNHGSWPATGAPGQSAPARSEMNNITAGFNKLPALTGNGGKAVVVNALGTAMSVTAAALTLAVALTATGAGAITLTSTGATNVTLPTTGTLATLAGSETLTNKTLTNPTINAATISGTIAGAATFSGALTLSSALTYGGVTLSNSVTGTGSMVLSASPTLTGTLTTAAIAASGSLSLTGAADHYMRGGSALFWNSTGASGGTLYAYLQGKTDSSFDVYASGGINLLHNTAVTGALTASGTVNSTAVKSYVFSLAGGATKTVTVTVPAGAGQFMVLVGGNQSGAEGYAYASWMLGGDFADAGTPAYAFSNIVAPVSNFRLSFSTITIGSGSFTFQAISSAGSNTASITVTIIGALHTGAVPTISAS